MASGLLDTPIARTLLDAASQHGLDLAAALGGDDDALRATEVAQPALLFVEVVLGVALYGSADGGPLDVVGVAGHSVGEYAALVVAGALEPAAAMGLVIERGRAMAAMREGGMAALLGADAALAAQICAEASRDGGVVVVANLNAPGQVVLSGSRDALDRALALARERGVRRAMPLNVSGAFHSPLMAPAAERFAASLDAAPFAGATVPVVCNVDAEAVRDAAGLRQRLRAQLTAPVRWVDCVQRLVALGADTLVEVGPGSVLSGLARRIAPEVRVMSVNSLDAAVAAHA